MKVFAIYTCILIMIFRTEMAFSEDQMASEQADKNTISNKNHPICDISKVKSIHGDEATYSYPLSIEFIEKNKLVTVEIDGIEKTLPFGFINKRWEELKSLYKEGDCILFFRSSEQSWKSLSGLEAYVLIRNGELIYVLVSQIS